VQGLLTVGVLIAAARTVPRATPSWIGVPTLIIGRNHPGSLTFAVTLGGIVHQQFYIPATASLQERRPRILKHNDTFGLFDHNGDILTGPASPEGIFHRDTRHLSRLNVILNDAPPLLLSSTIRNDNAMLRCDLTNSDVYENGELVLEHDLIHLRRSKFIWNDACFERLVIRNYANHDQSITLAIDFEADFADIFEVRGSQRELRGTVHPPELGIDRVILAYSGRDNRTRQDRKSVV